MQKLGIYLEKVMKWEVFGYQLLPENKEHLMEVLNTICFQSIPYGDLLTRIHNFKDRQNFSFSRIFHG